MDIIAAIKSRASTRAFLEKSVSKELIIDILETARWTPSGKNVQPWQVSVVSGEAQQNISERLLSAYNAGEKPRPDYQYYSDQLTAEQKKRAFDCGMALYGALGIQREDKLARNEMWKRNYQFFDAPVALLVWLDQKISHGSCFDVGAFCQSIMLAALEYGLATCPQASLAEYPDIVRAELGDDYKNKSLICGLALGYPDVKAPVNNYRTARLDLADFVTWHD